MEEIKKYKVTKAFDEFEKGDVFVGNENGGYEFREISEKPGYREETIIEVNKEYIDEMVEEGYLTLIEEEDSCGCCDKLEKVKLLVDTLLDTYKEDYENLLKAFEQGDVQQCVKVEAETVYYNLNKVLTRIKQEIDE